MESVLQSIDHLPLSSRSGGSDPYKHTQTPVTTGTSVIAIQFDKGVMMAADMLASYGSLARYRNCPRLMKVNKNTIWGCMGDYADYQFLKDFVEQMVITEECKDDGFSMTPRSLHSWLTRVLYNKRSNFDPLWVNFVVGGSDEVDGEMKPFLGSVDKLGTSFKDPVIATGYGAHLASALLRSAVDAKKEQGESLTELEARKLLIESMKVLYYRDARAFHKFQIGVAYTDGREAQIEGPLEIESDWSVANMIQGYE